MKNTYIIQPSPTTYLTTTTNTTMMTTPSTPPWQLWNHQHHHDDYSTTTPTTTMMTANPPLPPWWPPPPWWLLHHQHHSQSHRLDDNGNKWFRTSPLYKAARKGNTQIVLKLVLEDADPSLKCSPIDGVTAKPLEASRTMLKCLKNTFMDVLIEAIWNKYLKNNDPIKS